MEEAIEIEISENHQLKAVVFLSMMHSPKRQVIKISILCMCVYIYMCVCVCVYIYIYAHAYVHTYMHVCI